MNYKLMVASLPFAYAILFVSILLMQSLILIFMVMFAIGVGWITGMLAIASYVKTNQGINIFKLVKSKEEE